MNLVKYLLVGVIIFGLVACGSTAAEPTPVESQTASSPTPAPSPSPTVEITPEIERLPTSTPTPGNDIADSAQSSPVITPSSGGSPQGERPELDGANLSGDEAIVFHRTGGIAGIEERWLIYPDGRVVGPNAQTGQVEPEQIQEIVEQAAESGFFEMEEAYLPTNTCCDRFFYQITIRSRDQVQTVTTIDAAAEAPEALWQVVDAIGRLIVEASE